MNHRHGDCHRLSLDVKSDEQGLLTGLICIMGGQQLGRLSEGGHCGLLHLLVQYVHVLRPLI